MTHDQPEMKECIERCGACHDVCVETTTYCLDTGGSHAEASHIGILRDCEEICGHALDAMLRDSEFATSLCELCAEICERCAKDCDGFGNDEKMRRCAEECRRCAEACRRMVSAARTVLTI